MGISFRITIGAYYTESLSQWKIVVTFACALWTTTCDADTAHWHSKQRAGQYDKRVRHMQRILNCEHNGPINSPFSTSPVSVYGYGTNI